MSVSPATVFLIITFRYYHLVTFVSLAPDSLFAAKSTLGKYFTSGTLKRDSGIRDNKKKFFLLFKKFY